MKTEQQALWPSMHNTCSIRTSALNIHWHRLCGQSWCFWPFHNGTSGHSSFFCPAYRLRTQPCVYEWHFWPLYLS